MLSDVKIGQGQSFQTDESASSGLGGLGACAWSRIGLEQAGCTWPDG